MKLEEKIKSDNETESSDLKPFNSWKLWILPIFFWSALVFGDLTWNIDTINHYMVKMAKDKGESFFKQIEITRIWNARHGGVYAIITEDNQPNPYLDVPDRDIVTLGGMELTMINPAYMTRQIAEIAKEKNGTIFHITSLNPIRPGNAADKWETVALRNFEEGLSEQLELVDDDSQKSFKYMAPLFVKKACMACHSKQGYMIGDIRGGISVTLPAKPFLDASYTQKRNQIFLHAGIFIIGVFCIFYFRICSHRYWSNLKKSNDQLLHAGKLAAVGKLSASIAHEFNNPICGIRNVLSMVKRRYEQGNIKEDDKNLVTMAIKECDRITELTKRLRDFYRPTHGKKSLININETINELEIIYKKKLTQRNIFLEKDYGKDIPKLNVVADQIKQVLLNILQNAEESINDEGGKIILKTEHTDSNVSVHIKDTGHGIPQKDIETIFDPFFTTKSATQGTGLGLSVCHGIIKNHKGDIMVVSQYGKGTTFTIILPVDSEI